jgi:hypothetical protein
MAGQAIDITLSVAVKSVYLFTMNTSRWDRPRRRARQQAYRALFRESLDALRVEEIRETINRGWPLGGERFKDEIEAAAKRTARPPRRGRPTMKCGPDPI